MPLCDVINKNHTSGRNFEGPIPDFDSAWSNCYYCEIKFKVRVEVQIVEENSLPISQIIELSLLTSATAE